MSSETGIDEVLEVREGEDHIHCTGLKRGSYFMMVTGYDTITNARVTGSMGYTLGVSTGEVDLDFPVN